jgi:homoserine kinase type II
MAVYSFITESDWREIEALFDFGRIIAAKPIAEGVENSNYLLEVEAQNGVITKYILTIFEQRVSEADLPFFLYLKQYLQENGYNCPVPIINKNAELYFKLRNKPAAIVSFLNGHSIEMPLLSHVKQAGEYLAKLHQTALNFNEKRRNTVAYSDWLQLRDKISHVATKTEHVEWLTLINSELEVQGEFWQNQHLPSGIIHADFFPNNVFFDLHEQLCGVIDFYFACHDVLSYDLAIVANAWCFDADFNLNAKYFAELINNYQHLRPLSNQEIAAMPMLLRASALRFLLTRLHDVLYISENALVQPHDPYEYAHKLKYWRNQANLI